MAACIAGVLLIVGVAIRSLPPVTVGGTLAFLALTLALWDSPPSSVSILGAILFGLALLLLAEAAYYGQRLRGALVRRSLWRRQIAWWLARAAITSGVSLIIVALGGTIAAAVPFFGRPILAGAGALLAIGAASAFVWPKRDDWR